MLTNTRICPVAGSATGLMRVTRPAKRCPDEHDKHGQAESSTHVAGALHPPWFSLPWHELVGAFTGELEYGQVRVDLIAFFDAGVAWTKDTDPTFFGSGDRSWVRSVGFGARVNAFGYLVMELAAVRPLDRVRNGWQFVFGVTPGF